MSFIYYHKHCTVNLAWYLYSNTDTCVVTLQINFFVHTIRNFQIKVTWVCTRQCSGEVAMIDAAFTLCHGKTTGHNVLIIPRNIISVTVNLTMQRDKTIGLWAYFTCQEGTLLSALSAREVAAVCMPACLFQSDCLSASHGIRWWGREDVFKLGFLCEGRHWGGREEHVGNQKHGTLWSRKSLWYGDHKLVGAVQTLGQDYRGERSR